MSEFEIVTRFLSRVDAWANEESHRGSLVRSLRADIGQQHQELQARRLCMLSHYVTADSTRGQEPRFA